ncbi:MAG: RNA polymerase sigma factor [Terracidiphilus sp.]|jgi:RNA polymerase sigma-70 factor (ECF subfamily)
MQNETNGILTHFQQGSETAFETLFHQHQRQVYGWLLRIVRDPAAAEDLTIESFWRIHQAHARFDPAQGFEGWARRIATRAALDWLRARRPESELGNECAEELAAPAAADPAMIAELRCKTALAFSSLPPKLRIAATLAVIEEQPQKDVAAALGISIAAVKVRVFRALRLLRKELERQGITP